VQQLTYGNLKRWILSKLKVDRRIVVTGIGRVGRREGGGLVEY
jgi:hypothetical protein